MSEADGVTCLMQALFAARVIFDILGRLAPKARWVQTESGLLVWSLIRLAITPLFFLYIGNRLPWASAELAVAYVAVFWCDCACAQDTHVCQNVSLSMLCALLGKASC